MSEEKTEDEYMARRQRLQTYIHRTGSLIELIHQSFTLDDWEFIAIMTRELELSAVGITSVANVLANTRGNSTS